MLHMKIMLHMKNYVADYDIYCDTYYITCLDSFNNFMKLEAKPNQFVNLLISKKTFTL